MKALLLFLTVIASFAVYFALVTQGVFQKTAWPHYLVALAAIVGLGFQVAGKPGALGITCLVGAVGITGLMAWWMFRYSAYGDAPELAADVRLPVAEVGGLEEAIAGRPETKLVFYRGFW